jgi:hypothetical protein
LTLLVIGGIAAGAFLFFGVISVIKSTDAYKTALSAAQNSPEVQEELGTPIKDGFMPSGSVNADNGNTTADFTIPLSGPKGSGKLHFKGSAKAGEAWTPEEFEVTIDADGKVIELGGSK